MKRRSFLKILSLAPAVVAAPSAAMAAIKLEAAPLMSGAASFYYRPDINAWMGYAVSGKVEEGKQYDFVTLFYSDPDRVQQDLFCRTAELSFERARKKAQSHAQL